MKKEIKTDEENATFEVTNNSGPFGSIGPRYPGYDGDNCHCGGVMIMQFYPSQPEGKQEWKCGMCGRQTYLDVGPRSNSESSGQASEE